MLARIIESVSAENMKCYSSTDAWAVSAKLLDSGLRYCVDSTGFSGDQGSAESGVKCK